MQIILKQNLPVDPLKVLIIRNLRIRVHQHHMLTGFCLVHLKPSRLISAALEQWALVLLVQHLTVVNQHRIAEDLITLTILEIQVVRIVEKRFKLFFFSFVLIFFYSYIYQAIARTQHMEW